MRTIDAEALKAHYAWWKSGTRKYSLEGMRVIFDSIIDEQPTIDPVKHGKWTWESVPTIDNLHKYHQVRCSVCGERFISEVNYCPNCGARMDGK